MIKLIIDRDNDEMGVTVKGRAAELMAEYTMLTREFLNSFHGENKKMMEDYFKSCFVRLVTSNSNELKSILFKSMMDSLFSEDKS